MAITNINLSTWNNFKDGNSFPAASFNSFVNTLQTKINELISGINGGAGGGSAPSTAFTVNGVTRQPSGGIVQLPAKGKYVLRGTLNGRVVIGSASDTWGVDEESPTQVILDGCIIVTDSNDNAAISYKPSFDKCFVTLAPNTYNHLVCTHVATKTDGQNGALHCDNNLIVQGSGYLSCINRGGHGIKASELRMSGHPHVYVEAVHDGIHGNKMLIVDGGLYYVNKANDAFGTRAAEPALGKAAGTISIFGGDFYAYNIAQNVFDSKAPGYAYRLVGVHTDVSVSNVYAGITVIDPKVYFGNAVQDTTNGGYSTQPVGTVKCYSNKDLTLGETTITPSGGVYTLTTAYAKVSGYVAGNITTSIQSTDITLNDAYIEGNVAYAAAKKKLQVNVESGKTGMISGNLTSGSNLAVEVKNDGHFVLGGDLLGDELTFNDSKGSILVDGNVTGKDIYIGTAASPDATKKLYGSLQVGGTMTAILNSKFNKGYIHVLDAGLVGSFTVNVIEAHGYADLANPNVSYRMARGIVCGAKSQEPYDVIPYGYEAIPNLNM